MTRSIRRRATLCISVLAAMAFALPGVSSGATINIILSGVDVTYLGTQAGGSVYDAVAHLGGNQTAAEADEVVTAVYELDNAHVGTLVSDAADRIYLDLKIDGVGASLAKGPLHAGIGTNAGFGVELFTSNSGQLVSLDVSSIDLLVTDNVLFFTGEGTLNTHANPAFGLRLSQSEPVVFSYSATLPGLVGAPVTSAIASGALTISGTLIPEPTTSMMLVAGLLVSVFTLRRRNG